MNVTDIKDFNLKCTGCGACYNSCPMAAISMQTNEEGFLYPSIDKNKCIDCSLCNSNCHVNKDFENQTFEKLQFQEAFSIDKDTRRTSSSGGIAYELAKHVTAKGGIVFGAIMDADLKVVHEYRTFPEEVYCFSGSKYLQSDTSTAYKQVKDFLLSQKSVLFIGTPCQIRGLKSFLDCSTENLYTVDFICHGVPSYNVFDDMISHLEKKHNKKITSVSFRDKINGWQKSTTTIIFSDGTKTQQINKNFAFYRLFLDNKILRNSCFFCSSASSHCSDITIGDFWATSNKDDKGVSLICCNTNKGTELLEKIAPSLRISTISDRSKLIPCYAKHESTYDIKEKQLFWTKYNKSGYKKFAKSYERKIKITNLVKKIFSLPKRTIKKLFK